MSTRILVGDCRQGLASLPERSVQTCVTSPPYFGLRDYGVSGQIGLEATPEAFVAELVAVFHEVRRVLRDDGTLWLNLGDSYSRSLAKGGSGPGKNADYGDAFGVAISARVGSSDGAVGRADRPGSRSGGLGEKQLLGIPWRVAFALQADGWYLRSDIIWHKPNPMPESVTDRPTKAHEYLFLLSKSPTYYYDADAIAEPAMTHPTDVRNRRTVWKVPTRPYKGAHFATFPPALIEPCILAGSKPGDTVLDPFGGAGTTALVANQHGRTAILCELNPAYAALAAERIGPVFTSIEQAA